MLRRAAFVVAMVAVLVVPSFAQAQKKGGGGAPKGTEIIGLSATVAEVVQQGIVANGKDGKKYAIGFDAKSKVGLKGNASIDFVTPGSYVQFDVNLNERGEPTDLVKKIQITDKSPINEPGIYSSKGPDGKPGEPGPYFVRGTVRSNSNGKLTVVAGNKTMSVEVAPGVSVPVTVNDWRMARSGDTMRINGTGYSQAGAPMTIVLGTQVEITAVMPLEKKRPGQR